MSGFWLDKYEVTVGRFRQFVNAVILPDGGLGWFPPAGSGKHTHLNGGNGLSGGGGGYEPGWVSSDDSHIAPTETNLTQCVYATWTTSPGGRENLPINCVSWYEAYAFCIWDGGFLPSEAEWEYAAAGGSEQRRFPWGSQPAGLSNQYAVFGCYYPNDFPDCVPNNGPVNIAPVGKLAQGVGLWGQLDLAGNVLEWNLDFYSYSYMGPWIDAANLSGTAGRVYRGGDFFDSADQLLPTSRGVYQPGSRDDTYGIRCARTQ